MDPNPELRLAKAGPPPRWEDEEKATNDVAQLREEYRRRLCGDSPAAAPAEDRNGSSSSERK